VLLALLGRLGTVPRPDPCGRGDAPRHADNLATVSGHATTP
jgi:hypothetical protein